MNFIILVISLLKFVKWDKVPVIYSGAARKNLNLELLEKRLELSQNSLDQIKNTSKIGLSLNLQYETNGVDDNRRKMPNVILAILKTRVHRCAI